MTTYDSEKRKQKWQEQKTQLSHKKCKGCDELAMKHSAWCQTHYREKTREAARKYRESLTPEENEKRIQKYKDYYRKHYSKKPEDQTHLIKPEYEEGVIKMEGLKLRLNRIKTVEEIRLVLKLGYAFVLTEYAFKFLVESLEGTQQN